MKKIRFPHEVRRGSVIVRVYESARPATATRSGRIVYQVGWNAGGVRQLKQFARLSEALDEARLKADQLAAGKVETAANLTAEDAAALIEARRIAGDVPIVAALQEWAKARDLTGGQILAASKAWKDAHGTATRKVLVSVAVDEFLAAKARAGVDVKCSYMKTLPKLKADLGGRPIGSISARALESWIHEAFKVGKAKQVHAVTFNTVRKRVVSLWRWCRKQGYLPRTAQTEAEQLETAREESGEIGILTVADFARVLTLMKEEHPEHLACAVCAGFTGLRRTELHAQKWSDVHIDRGFLRVSKAKRNTPSKRLVQLSDAAVGWLMLCDRSGEMVSPPWGLDRVRAFAREAHIECPENGFRHSYISYRVAMTGNVAETALEAGNSPDVVHKHYRELVAKSEGMDWFTLSPAEVTSRAEGTVVSMKGVG